MNLDSNSDHRLEPGRRVQTPLGLESLLPGLPAETPALGLLWTLPRREADRVLRSGAWGDLAAQTPTQLTELPGADQQRIRELLTAGGGRVGPRRDDRR